MQDHQEHRLPDCAVTFIDQLVRRIRYRKKVRQEVRQELVGYFADELSRCRDDQTRQERASQLIQEFGDPRLLAALIRRAKKRCRPIHVRLAIRTLQILAAVVVYLVICILLHSIGRPGFSVDYLDYLNDLVSAGKDQSLNARRYYQEAVALLTNAMRWPSELGDSSPIWPGDMNETQLAATARLISGSEQALEAFEKATELPDYWSHYSLEPPSPPPEGLGQPAFRPSMFSEAILNPLMKDLAAYRDLVRRMRTRCL